MYGGQRRLMIDRLSQTRTAYCCYSLSTFDFCVTDMVRRQSVSGLMATTRFAKKWKGIKPLPLSRSRALSPALSICTRFALQLLDFVVPIRNPLCLDCVPVLRPSVYRQRPSRHVCNLSAPSCRLPLVPRPVNRFGQADV